MAKSNNGMRRLTLKSVSRNGERVGMVDATAGGNRFCCCNRTRFVDAEKIGSILSAIDGGCER